MNPNTLARKIKGTTIKRNYHDYVKYIKGTSMNGDCLVIKYRRSHVDQWD